MEKQNLKIKVDVTSLPNKMHFGVQLTTRGHVFRDRTKYNRKEKHRQQSWAY